VKGVIVVVAVLSPEMGKVEIAFPLLLYLSQIFTLMFTLQAATVKILKKTMMLILPLKLREVR